MASQARLIKAYPWIKLPLVVSAPMRMISLSNLAVEVSKAGGIGFLAAGTSTTLPALATELTAARALLPPSAPSAPLPIGIGFILHSGLSLPAALPILAAHPPAAVWLFGWPDPATLSAWAAGVRDATAGVTRVWAQVGTVAEAREACAACAPDVLVVQGGDAGGHGLARSASVVALVPEVVDAVAEGEGERPLVLAAGGIVDGRGVAAALSLGAVGAVMGTRYLAAEEAVVAAGYRRSVLAAVDGGVRTARTGVYDRLRGTTGWPERYDARGILNRSYWDAQKGMDEERNRALYKEVEAKAHTDEEGVWGEEGRMTMYAGSAVGLVKSVQSAARITEEVRNGASEVLKGLAEAVPKQ